MMTLVVVGLCQVGDRFLVQQRPKGLREGLWEFPGGKRERGETMAQALIREWEEELGVDVAVGDYVTDCVLTFPDLPDVLLPLFRVTIVSGEPTAKEGQKIEWMTLGELKVLDNTPAFYEYLPVLKGLPLTEESLVSRLKELGTL